MHAKFAGMGPAKSCKTFLLVSFIGWKGAVNESDANSTEVVRKVTVHIVLL
jgi:hypothetical protein